MHGAVYIANYIIINILLKYGSPISVCCYYRRTYAILSPIIIFCHVLVINFKKHIR